MLLSYQPIHHSEFTVLSSQERDSPLVQSLLIPNVLNESLNPWKQTLPQTDIKATNRVFTNLFSEVYRFFLKLPSTLCCLLVIQTEL